MRRRCEWGLLGALLLWAAAGCAVNLSEGRPARVLRGGEVQFSEVNSIVIPTRVAGDLVAPGRSIVNAIDEGKAPSDEEQRALVGSAAAIALTGPGYGGHLEAGVGLGYRFDLAARVGNGIYALSLRRGFDLGLRWHGNLGVRGGYNSGSAMVPYVEDINQYVKVGQMRRFDGQAFLQLGREFGEWGKLWLGAKGMVSPFKVEIDASRAGLGTETVRDRMTYYGGFVGFALGYRYVYYVVELSVLQASGDVTVFGRDYDLSGLTLSPTWGLQGTF